MSAVPKPSNKSSSSESKKSAIELVDSTYTPEIVIALCGPIGSPLHAVGDAIKRQLTPFDYECRTIRLSTFIEEHANKAGERVGGSTEFERIRSLIRAGDALRRKYGKSVLAQLAVAKIRIERHQRMDTNSNPFGTRRMCHIIDSIKNQDELELLRLVYGEMLFAIGVFSPMQLRERNLADRSIKPHEISSLVQEDSGTGSDEGQTVRKTFPLCDMFLRIEKGTGYHLEQRVERFVHLMLGFKVITPTKNETAMYAAAMASANSACLSRQVGACVTDADGNVLSVGWNDVPAPYGGLYDGADPESDHRCWNHGAACANDAEKDLLSKEILDSLGELVPPDKHEEARTMIRESDRLKSLIEFSRAIHAEMHAIINAGQAFGGKLQGGRLFATTYPCHSCARHIVAAGITEVYFIEPYVKSLALKLHSDALTEDENDTNKVRILAYDGVAPSRYLSLFRVPADSRKESGKLTITPQASVRPRTPKTMQALEVLESLIVSSSEIAPLVDQEASHESNQKPQTA